MRELVSKWMDKVVVNEREILAQIGKMKNRKQGGLDGIKTEMYKAVGKSKKCLETMNRVMNEMMDTGLVKDEWKRSKTRMIPKVNKTKCRAAQTNCINGCRL